MDRLLLTQLLLLGAHPIPPHPSCSKAYVWLDEMMRGPSHRHELACLREGAWEGEGGPWCKPQGTACRALCAGRWAQGVGCRVQVTVRMALCAVRRVLVAWVGMLAAQRAVCRVHSSP